MDFYQICTRETKGVTELYPDFTVGRSKDLMVRGKSFYAVWDDEQGLWSTDEYDVQRLIDEELRQFDAKNDIPYNVKYLRSASNGGWYAFQKFLKNVSDNSKQLDDHLTFANTEVKKSDYASRRLPYRLEPGDFSAWDELVGTLYNSEERAKIEWAIGAVVAGDAKKIQKFFVFYGPPGSGKSTILNIVQKMFDGYTTTFDAKALGSSGAAFATEVFKNNPLVAIQHDGDLSKLEDNARLNSIVSHEDMPMNEKYKPGYTAKVNAMLFMGTNQPVKISDAKSGIIRRLIDIHPTGVKIPINHYHTLMAKIDFELGAIAAHCLEVYRDMGKNHYNGYRPLEMMLQTDVFFNFIEASFDIFKLQDGTTLRQAYSLYKEFCADTGIDRVLPMYKVREELRNYFDEFHDRYVLEGANVRSYYSGFNANKFKVPAKEPNTFSLVLEEKVSLLDTEFAELPAQLARINEFGDEIPAQKWASVRTTLADIDTQELHFVKVPEKHIVIDFDLKDPETGEKSLERNLEAASVWPPTYAELSKGGNGVHLHYNYEGDVTQLSSSYSEGIEVKTLLGDASLRRRLSYCNNIPVATLNMVLPLKEKKMLSEKTIKTEKGLRDLIDRNLRKEIHPSTKSSVDFIKKILDEAHESGMTYDLTDLRPVIMSFAMNSSNQSLQALKVVNEMKWASEGEPKGNPDDTSTQGAAFGGGAAAQAAAQVKDERNVFFDVEVYPNLFIICWKFQGADNIVKMINPSAADVEALLKLRLIGFNNRRYDNHMIYGRFMGMSNKQLFDLSQKIVNNDRNSMFVEAYNLSYADIYDFSSKKQSLKKFMIDLGIHKIEMDIPWDEDVPEELIPRIVEYCCNDVLGTEATFEDRKSDFVARQILAELSGLTVNDTTAKHTARIIFGADRNAQSKFRYTDLSKTFPGYEFDFGKSTYRGEDPSEGGYVYAEKGIYHDVAVLDVASMHPTSLIEMNYFGEYTKNYEDLLKARIAIKHEKFDDARKMLDGKLKPYLEDESTAEDLSYALKIVINIVYGMTSAKFDNPFRIMKNKDNIVAKRGALFMIDLKHFVQEKGFTVAHIKTDSIKIPNATPEIIGEVMEFGKKYGYTFEHEATYSKFCLVNDAVYIAKVGWAAKEKKIGKWEAVGAQFQHPYVYKTLFSLDDLIEPDDYYEAKQVMKGHMTIDFDSVQNPMHKTHSGEQFIGRTGLFLPVMPESGGGILYRVHEGKKYAVTGTKGHVWLEAEMAKRMGSDLQIDMSYYEDLASKAVQAINQFGDFQEFLK
ncbi:MAG: hypothetical protein IPM04_13350 [Saprospiraceae bacterium]|nr:DUF5906 domain-containing protein [Candidatus Brachybacter algidus]MBK8748804.1 hypothetical protein [Candidatus Brachybacter algidus]